MSGVQLLTPIFWWGNRDQGSHPRHRASEEQAKPGSNQGPCSQPLDNTASPKLLARQRKFFRPLSLHLSVHSTSYPSSHTGPTFSKYSKHTNMLSCLTGVPLLGMVSLTSFTKLTILLISWAICSKMRSRTGVLHSSRHPQYSVNDCDWLQHCIGGKCW